MLFRADPGGAENGDQQERASADERAAAGLLLIGGLVSAGVLFEGSV